MEFKLNKIDTELRQRINEERSVDKIHNKKGININKDKKKDQEDQSMERKKAKGHEQEQLQNEVETKEKTEDRKKDPNRGNFIDIRR